MPDPVRRLPVPPLAGLEGQGCGALGSGGPAVRLPHSLPVRSSSLQGSHLSAFVPPLVHQRGGAERLYSGPRGQVRSGASSPAFSRFLQPAVRRLEDLRVLETRHRSLDPRSNGWKLELKRFNTSQCGNFFTYKIALIWNRLPAEAVNSASVEQFKIELDKVIDTLI